MDAHPVSPMQQGLSLLTQKKRRQVLLEWNATHVDHPQELCIHALFEEQVQRSADATAVVSAGEQLTYRELDQRAAQVARRLRQLGVGPDTVVGICVERSPAMVVGLLGILKAGGAYLPLDPTYPRDRLGFMLDNSQAPVLLTQSGLQERLPLGHRPRVIYLDSEWTKIAPEQGSLPPSPVGSDHLAYVIYTSGSTGTPKGVMITHRSLVHSISARFDYYAEPASRCLLLTSFAFDSSVAAIFWPLCQGGTLVLPEEHAQRDMQRVAEWIAGEQISHVILVGSLYSLLLTHARQHSLDCLQVVVVAGETCPRELVIRHHELLPRTALFNEYGPTEATVWTTVHRCRASEPNNRVPIGRPIVNTQVYLLDRQQQPVAPGLPGELYIGGAGLARGYLNQPALTAERFIPNPFSTKPGSRLYRSGDLARYLPDGNIEFLGRIDNQVKIRAVRVEPEEVEAALGKHPDVSQGVVVAREDKSGETKLVAYVVAAREPAPRPGALRAFLREQLPESMVPAHWVVVQDLPRTANGKIDRRALPAPDGSRPEAAGALVSPRTSVEEAVADIWADVLGVERVGVHDNFFDLGGDSLLASRVVARMRDVFRHELPMRRFYETPTVAHLAEWLEEDFRAEPADLAPPLVPVARTGDQPLSFAQQRLWFLGRLMPHSPVYNVPLALRLAGPLEVTVLERCFAELVRRHESLRTIITTNAGQPVARGGPTSFGRLPLRDLSGLAEQARQVELGRLLAAEARQPFDLAEDLMLRARLVRLGEQDHVLALTMHHIASDDWSLDILYRELAALYQAYSAGQPSPLPELPLQYADYALWQRTWLRRENLQTRLDYWKQHLAGAPAVLELPTDHPRLAVQGYRGARQAVVLDRELSLGLEELSRREHATLFMMLLAAFQTLLARYSGQEDIVVGCPIAGRNHTELEGLIGFFANTLVLRTDLSGNPTFRELLARVRETALGAYAHQDMPFEQLVEELQPQRTSSHQPLFQVMFVLQNAAPLDGPELVGLTVSPLEVDTGTTKFDLTLALTRSPTGLRGVLEYDADLFEADTIARLLGHFQTLLAGIVAQPDQRLTELPFLTQAERHQVLVAWNATTTVYPQSHCLPDLVEAQVERTPDAVAVVFEGRQVTYRDLNARANRLARHLQRLGVGPDGLVAVYLERSLDLVVGLLAVLKAGGAYLPLDPDYPRDRLVFMLQDSQAPVLLTRQGLAGELPPYGGQVLCLDGDRGSNNGEPAANPQRGLTSEHLAYVIYTSGSTGKPKGAMNTQRGICNRLLWMQDTYRLTAADRVLQKTPFSFDVSVWEFFWPLLAGARLVVARPGGHRDTAYLVRLIAEQQVTVLHFVPSMLQVFLERPDLEGLSSLREVICSGEALPYELQERFQARLPARLHNLYGPTEAAVDVTSWECQRGSRRRLVPIGRPIANTQVYVLDQHGQPVPVGVPGELYLGGVGLARGYLNRPELTAERFVPNPFGPPGERLYRTGDRVRWLPEGTLDYLGRLDHQVKIRGFRIELGEIETVLSQHAAVREAVVVTRADRTGDKRLAAYMVAEGSTVPTSSELRAFLKDRLPEYMVPSAWVFLAAMPLSPNGKVDRAALPVPDPTYATTQGSRVAPRSLAEQQLATIWFQVLGLERAAIGIHDNFFDLGGHSLLAVRLFSEIEKLTGKALPLATLFQAPTIAQLAEILTREDWTPDWSPLVPIQPLGQRPPLFCAHDIGGNVLCFQALARCLGPDQPVYGLQAQGLDGRQVPSTRIEEMAACYVREILALQPLGPYFLAGHSFGGVLAFEMAQQLCALGKEVGLVGLLDSPAGYQDAPTPVAGRWQMPAAALARIDLHVRTFCQVPWLDKPGYLWRRSRTLLWRAAYRAHRIAFGDAQPVPRALSNMKQACVLAARSYIPRVYAGRVTLFRSKYQPVIRGRDSRSGWNRLAAGGVEVREVPGDHMTMLTEPYVRILAKELRCCLPGDQSVQPSTAI